MNRFLVFMLLLFFVSGSFTVVFSSVSASEVVEDSWNTKKSMSQARYGLGVVAVEGKIYAIGGATSFNTYDGSMGGFVGTNECYDPKTDTWTTLKPMPTPRCCFAIAAYQGKIYCIGGNAVGEMMWPTWGCGVTEVYDIATNSWSTKKTMPSNGYNLQAHVIDGKIFVLSATNSTLYTYDPNTDSWTKKTDMPLPNGLLWIFGNCVVSAVMDNNITVWMLQLQSDIYTYNFNSETTEQRTLVYNPLTDVWSERNIEPVTFVGSGVAKTTTGWYAPQKAYILKWDSTGENTINQVYDSAKDTWTTAKTIPTPRKDFGVAIVDDVLYVIGGRVVKSATDHNGSPLVYESSSVNEQYVSFGYGFTHAPEQSNPTVEQSNLPTEYYSVFFTEHATSIMGIIVGVVVSAALLFLYIKSLKSQKDGQDVKYE